MSKELDELNAAIEKDMELERRKKAVQEKDLTLREYRVGRDLEELEKNTAEMEQAKTVKFSKMSAANMERLRKDNAEYMEAAKHAMTFINKEFKKAIPYFRKNLILIGGDTGDGKSTTVANLIFSTITQKNPATGKACRVLVLSNEEAPEDFYNRCTCLVMGWKYTNHDQFTDEQRKTFDEWIPKWVDGGRLTIIGDTYEGIPGWTTTPEGIETMLNNILESGQPPYDVVIIDYYQNVTYSKTNPKLDEFMCQRKLSNMLDQMKRKYPGPIVLMAQMKRLTDEEDTTPFNVRLKGSKLICDKATFISELIPERRLLRSRWKVWKSRFTESIGDSIYTGYDRGKFVPYSLEFQANVAKLVNANAERDMEQEAGLITPKGEEDGSKDT